MRRAIVAGIAATVVAGCVMSITGCGYTTQCLLPAKYKSIYIDSFKNKIDVSAEQNNLRMYRGYRPAMEVDVTKAVSDRFIFDGNLKVAKDRDADLYLAGELIDFRKEPLRYDANDNIEEYRLKVIVDIELTDARTGERQWIESSFAGETTYRTTGSLAKTETTALDDAIADLARRVVERTIEAW